jgi:hypothetical protein
MSAGKMRHRESLALYEKYIQDIRFTKSQIWHTLHLTVLGNSGIIGLSLILRNNMHYLYFYYYRPLLITALILLSALGYRAIMYQQESLKKFRLCRTYYQRNLLSQDVSTVEPPITEANETFFNNLFLMIIAASFTLSLFLLIW